jgi:tetratricopeptide (TPR) repeat protein
LEKNHRDTRRDQIRFPRPASFWLRPVAASVSLLGLAIVWTFAGRAAYGAFIADRWYAAALSIDSRARDTSAAASDDDYVDLIAAAEEAFHSEPENVNYSYWLSYYRWESISRAIDPESGRLILTPDTIAFTRRIADDLTATRRMCPTFGPPYALEGQLRLFVLQDPMGEELVRKGVSLAPYDPPTCVVAGELAARGGRIEEAKPLLARAVALHPDYFEEIAALYIAELKRPELACDLADDDYSRLSQVARILATDDQSNALVQSVRNKAEASLRRRVISTNATAVEIATLGRVEFDAGNFDSAIKLYQRALGQDYPNIEWRLALARALAKVGNLDDALHEVRICLRLRPHQAEAMALLEHLTDGAENARLRKE